VTTTIEFVNTNITNYYQATKINEKVAIMGRIGVDFISK
jgi:hypothetical protein